MGLMEHERPAAGMGGTLVMPLTNFGQNGGCEFEGVMDRNNTNSMRELVADSVISILETVRYEGSRSVKRNLEYYNLDVIISVGYRAAG